MTRRIIPDIEAIRAQVPAATDFIYLNTGWQGPSPLSVTRAVQDAFAAEAGGPTAPTLNEYRLAIFRHTRRALAELIGATREELSLQQNTTEGINIVLSGLGLKPGDEVITCSMEHTSVIVPAYHLRERLGVNLKIIRISAADTPDEIDARFRDAATERLKLILLSHISYTSGQLLPVQELAQIAHVSGGYLMLDAAQSVGQIPVDVRQIDCDFCAFPGHKWLLGPAGTGALYVRHGLIERLSSPKLSHHASEYFNFKDKFRSKSDTIDKFELTTVSVPLLAGLNTAIGFITQIGLDATRDHALGLARYLTERLAAIPGIRLVSAADSEGVASGLVAFSLPEIVPATLTAHLWERSRIVARTVPDGACTRVSFHIFNTEAEADAVVEAVADAAAHGVPERDHPSIQLETDALAEL